MFKYFLHYIIDMNDNFLVREKTIFVLFDNSKYIGHVCIRCKNKMNRIKDYKISEEEKQELSNKVYNTVYCPGCGIHYYIGIMERLKIQKIEKNASLEVNNDLKVDSIDKINQLVQLIKKIIIKLKEKWQLFKKSKFVQEIIKKYQDKKINNKNIVKIDKKEPILNKIIEFRQKYIKEQMEHPNIPEILESSFVLVEETLIKLSYNFFELYSKDILIPELLSNGNSIDIRWETEFYKIDISSKDEEGFYFHLKDKKNELNAKHGYSTKSNIIDLIIKWMIKQ
jgi:Pyruvate/2-oxoacid:ferredoxin oxidoreductase delta subunit